jgi:16S rRNA (cytosine967-C5)-methyltransferase
MRFIWQHVENILASYNGNVPLTHFLKEYYRHNPKLGSRDRKILNAMAYSWYRCAKGLPDDITLEKKIQMCLHFCQVQVPMSFEGPVQEPLNLEANALFPFEIALSDGITKEDWLASMLVQPDLFIRVRKQKEKITDILRAEGIPYSFVTDNCLKLPNGAKIDKLLPPEIYVVQDASSQQTGNYFHPQKQEEWYDCCCGAGGKSLLLKDLEPTVKLTVSDRRESIIRNLKERFRLYGIPTPTAFITDVSEKDGIKKTLGSKTFDNIICDAPCSGSGTWARTPEQLYFFNTELVAKYSALQENIAINAAAHLKKNGRLIYITCSVFKRENEEVTDKIVEGAGLQLVESQLINGIANKADSMYVAVLQKQ